MKREDPTVCASGCDVDVVLDGSEIYRRIVPGDIALVRDEVRRESREGARPEGPAGDRRVVSASLVREDDAGGMVGSDVWIILVVIAGDQQITSDVLYPGGPCTCHISRQGLKRLAVNLAASIYGVALAGDNAASDGSVADPNDAILERLETSCEDRVVTGNPHLPK